MCCILWCPPFARVHAAYPPVPASRPTERRMPPCRRGPCPCSRPRARATSLWTWRAWRPRAPSSHHPHYTPQAGSSCSPWSRQNRARPPQAVGRSSLRGRFTTMRRFHSPGHQWQTLSPQAFQEVHRARQPAQVPASGGELRRLRAPPPAAGRSRCSAAAAAPPCAAGAAAGAAPSALRGGRSAGPRRGRTRRRRSGGRPRGWTRTAARAW